MSGIGKPSVFHALVVIFLEFFAWGLLTTPIISVLNATFPDDTFLMNGLIMGTKCILSFLSAPLIGALSDVWGRKFLLLVTVFFTCAPIPFMIINTWWFFAMISISGVFAVTFAIVFAYVADVTTEEERPRAYGLVSATFAASMVTSAVLGAFLMDLYGEALVVAAATIVAVLDVFFLMVAVPESLLKVRPSGWVSAIGWNPAISWKQADPLTALRKVGAERTVLMLCVAMFLSYLPKAGQYSCISVYLKLVMGFSVVQVAMFTAIMGLLSFGVLMLLGLLMRSLGAKHTIIMGLVFGLLQFMFYSFGSRMWMTWVAGVFGALGSLTFPAINVYLSVNSRSDRQGVVQGMVTGVQTLCNGLGPAMFGFIFYLFHEDLNEEHVNGMPGRLDEKKYVPVVPWSPFVLGAVLVLCALLVVAFLPMGGPHSEEVRGSLPELRFEMERMAPDNAAV